jgi:hypothetical protein
MSIQFVKGDTKVFAVLCTRYNPTTMVDDPVTPVKAWFTAKRRSSDLDADAVILKDSTGSDVIITGNQVQVNIRPADTENVTDKWLRYDVQIREADGSVWTVERDKLELLPQETKVRV